MFKSIYHNFWKSLGMASLLWMIANAIKPSAVQISLLYVLATLALFSAVIDALLFDNVQLNSRQIWIRRGLFIAADGLVLPTLLYGFRVIPYRSPLHVAATYGEIILSYFVLTFFLYFLIDQNQKRALRKINLRLQENTED